jgi:hypothetical protein
MAYFINIFKVLNVDIGGKFELGMNLNQSVRNKNTSDNLNKSLYFGSILSEHTSESRSINPFNRFRTIYFNW